MSAYLDTSAAAVQAATPSLVIGTQVSWFWNQMPQPIASYNVSIGTRLTFKFSDSHNLWLMDSQEAYDACEIGHIAGANMAENFAAQVQADHALAELDKAEMEKKGAAAPPSGRNHADL